MFSRGQGKLQHMRMGLGQAEVKKMNCTHGILVTTWFRSKDWHIV